MSTRFFGENDGQNAISRRQFLKTTGAAVGALSMGSWLAGCGQKRAQMPGKRITITQWYHQYGEAGTQDAVQRYADEYMKANPEIGVKVVWVPGDYNTKLNTALLTAGGPDVFEKALTTPMVTAGQVAPLDDLFPPEIRGDFLKGDLEVNSVGGKIYGVKMVNDTGILYYRPSLLKAAGFEEPKTLDELLEVAKALTSSRRKAMFLGNDGGQSALISILPWSAGEDFLRGEDIVFDTPRAAQTYKKLANLSNSGTVLVGSPTDWWDPSAFIEEQCAMQWGGLWAYPQIRDEFKKRDSFKGKRDDVAAMAWPAFDSKGQPATFAGGWSQMVNASSPILDEAKKYVQWLWIQNKKIQEDWNLSYGFHVPPRLSVAKAAEALDAPVPSVAREALAKYGHFNPPAWSNSMGTALNDAVANIVKQGSAPEPQLKIAAAKCRRELERLLR